MPIEKFFLREIPPHVLDGVNSGAYKVVGSVVRDVATGKGVAFLQETDVLQRSVGDALGLARSFPPLDMAVNAVQDTVIISKLSAIESSLCILQSLQIGTFALAGLNLGVSIATFEMMRRKLNLISEHLKIIEQKIDRITEDRRGDEISDIFATIEHHLENLKTITVRKNKIHTAHQIENTLGESAKLLGRRFNDQLGSIEKGMISKKEIELLWIILNAIMVCYDSRLRALFTIDELPAAKELADQRSQSYAELCQIISADTLARDELLLPAETFVKALRESALMFSGRSELIGHLIECNIAGPDYLNEIANENTAPLLIREMK